MDDCLCFGDFVSLYSSEHSGYVFANHSSSVFNEVAVSYGGQKKPADENVLTFEVCPPTRFQLSRYYRDQLKKAPEDTSDGSDSNTRNQAAYEAEKSFNAAEIKRQKGQPVCYGQTVQFRHKFTNKFVHGSNVTTSSLEKENGSVTLQLGDSIDGQFKILSKHKFRREGDHVSLNESVIFESVSCPAYYLHVSEEAFNDDKYVYNKSFELNLSTTRSTFFITRNSTPSTEGETRLKTGDVVRFFHNEMQGYLVAEGSFNGDIRENVHLRLRLQNRERPHSLQPSSSAITYWQIELLTPSDVADGVIKQSSTVRLLHLCTRQYLCMETANRVSLTHDPLEAKAEFKLVYADYGADDVMSKSSYSLENISTKHWIRVSADYEIYRRLQSESNSDGRPLESLQTSKAKLVTVRGSAAPSVREQFSERQYEDLFVIEKVDQTDYMQYTFVAGMVPFLFKRQIATVQDTALSRNILKSFEEMISFMEVDGLPVKHRQKLFRNLGIIDRMIEILNQMFQPRNLHMCGVFKLIYDVLRTYVRGKSRKNKTHVARHMSLYFSHFSYLEDQVYQHALDMVNEFIKDNMEVVERITNDDLTKLVDYIRRDKEYRFLQLMDNFCICQSTAVQDNQKYITNSWLKSETKNCLYFTKMGSALGKDGTDGNKVFVTINNGTNWIELATLTKEPKWRREYQFFCQMLKTFENLCFGRNKYTIETLTSSPDYITVEQASTCLRNTELPEELRALYCQLIIALFVNTEEIQAAVRHIEELYLYRYNNGNEEEQLHITGENSGTENNNEQQGMKDLNSLDLTSFVDEYLSMDRIQTSTDVQTNKLTAQVLCLLNHLILLEKHDINERLISQLVQILNGKTDKPQDVTEEEIHRYRESERFRKSDSAAAIVETKIQCLNVLETIFNHALKSRLKELLQDFKRTKGSSEKPPEIMDPSIQPEERFASVATDLVKSVFAKTARFSNFDLPSILLDLTKYDYESLVTKSMETLYSYSSAFETLVGHAGKVQVLKDAASITKCTEGIQMVTVIKEKLSTKMMGANATEVVSMLDGLCSSEDGVPQTSVQNFLVSQGILDCIFTILTSKEHQADALVNSMYIDMFMRTNSMDIDSRPFQTSALHLLQRLVDGNERVQNLVFCKLDVLLYLQNKLSEVFQVIKLIFTGNINTCKQINGSQVWAIVQHLTRYTERHAAILLDILHTIVQPVRYGEPLRRNQNLVMRHIAVIKSKVAEQFSLNESSLVSFAAEPDGSKVTTFFTIIDLMASCAQNGSRTSKLTLQSVIRINVLFKILARVSHHRMKPCLRFLTYVFFDGVCVEEGGVDNLWLKNEITSLDDFLKSIIRDFKKISNREKFPLEALQKIISPSYRTQESTTDDGSLEESLCYIMEAVVPFCQCLCEFVPAEKIADSTQKEIANICEQFKIFLDNAVPYVDIIPLDLRKQLIDCLKTMKSCVSWNTDTLELEQKFNSEEMSTNTSDPDSEQEINRQYQTFVRNLMLASEGFQKKSELPSKLVKKKKLEFVDLDMKHDFKLLYQHVVVNVGKSKEEFDITGKIAQTLYHAKAVKVRHEVVYENPGLHKRYLQIFRMFLLEEIIKLPANFELYIYKNRRQLERVRNIQTTLVNSGTVECALQDLSPHLPDSHLQESLQLLNSLLFNGNQNSQDAIFQFLCQRPDVLFIATLQSRIAGFRDFAMDMNPDTDSKPGTDRQVKKSSNLRQETEVDRPKSGAVSQDLSNNPSTSQETTDNILTADNMPTADNIPMVPFTGNDRSPTSVTHGRNNKVHPFIENEDQKKKENGEKHSMDKVERETIEMTSLVLEFVSNVCQNQHFQLQNYFRVQCPAALSTDFVHVLTNLIDTVHTQINIHTVTVLTQTYDCLAQIVSGNADNKVAVLGTSVCEQTNFMLFMDMYRDCTVEQIYNLKKSAATFWRMMTEGTAIVHTPGGNTEADLASTAIEYLDSEVALQIMNQSVKDLKSKECKRIRGLVRTVGFQFCMLLERKLFIFPSLSKLDILKTEEDRDTYNSYSVSTRCVELLKDDTVHKVFFRVKDKHAYSDDIKERIKYDIDRSSPSQKIQDFMKWSSETTDYARHRWHVCRSGVGKFLVYSWLPFNYMMLILTLAILIMIGVDYDGGGNGSKRYVADRGFRVRIAVYALGGVHNFLSLVIFTCFITLNSPQFYGLMHLYQFTRSMIKGKPDDKRLREFEMQKKGSRLQINAYGPKMIYYTLFLIASICGTAFHGYTFALCLLQIVELNRYLKRICSVILHNGKYLGMTILLVLIILYMYAIGAFLFFREVYIQQANGHYCNSMPQCFVTILHHGLVGTAYQMFDHTTTSSFTDAVRIGLYNVSFFVVITILALYVVLACLVDGFLCLKQKMRHAKEDFRAVCFICGRPNADFSQAGKGFEEHVKREHNLWDYIYFFIHLDRTPTREYSALENYVYGQMKEGKYDFLPINRAICLEAADKAERMKMSDKKAADSEEKGLSQRRKKLRKLPSFDHETPKPKEKKHGQVQKDEARKTSENTQTLDSKHPERKQHDPYIDRQAMQQRRKSEAVPAKERRKSEAPGKDITKIRELVKQPEVPSQNDEKELQEEVKESQDVEHKIEDLQDKEPDTRPSAEQQGAEELGTEQQGAKDLGTTQQEFGQQDTEQQGDQQ